METAANETETTAPVVENETTTQPESEETVERPPREKRRGPVISYAVNPTTLEVRSYKGLPIFEVGKEIAVIEKDHMSRLPTPVLVALYNKVRPEKPITKFRDRKTAEHTMYPVLEVLAPKPLPGAGKTMPAAKKTARKGAAKKATTKETNAAGRKSAFSGKSITKLVDENPRRKGTHGFNSFALIKNGMTYEQYVEKGGRRNDLQWDIDHKYVKLS